MTKNIPRYILQINNTLQKANFDVYLVGGCVRDMLLNREVKDWDFATSATPEEILKLFPDGFYDNAFGTVGIPIEIDSEKNIIEITTFRTEHSYKDRRHPESVTWGKTIEEDLSRRDFTINAIALKLSNPLHPSPGRRGQGEVEFSTSSNKKIHHELIDPFNGQQDLKNKLIRAVGDPKLRFKEDALRLMRAIRLTTQLSFSIELNTMQEISNDAKLLTEIAIERIRDELLKILASDYPYDGIMLLRNANLLEYILPELLEGIGISQERPGRHHKNDVFTHNVLSLKHTPSHDPIVRFATLIHDVAKPRVASNDIEGYIIFHNHEIVGAKIAGEISARLRFSKKTKQKVVTLVRWHMFTVDEHTTDASIRRFIRRVGVENIKDLIDLRIGDRLGSGTTTAESWRLKLFKKRIEEQLAPAPFSINDMAIDGNDVMKVLNIKPGPEIGKILQKLFEEVDEDLSKNTKDYLLTRIKQLV